jgi:hypothetical protein
MSEKKKVIFIDSENQKVTEVFIEKNDCLKETYTMIGNGCHTVATAIYLHEHSCPDTIMVDDEGYFVADSQGFRMTSLDYEQMFIYGNAVIWGMDEYGELDNVKTTLEEISSKIKWVDKHDAAIIRERVMNTPPIITDWDWDI